MASKINVARSLLIPAFRGIEFIPSTWDFSFDQGHATHLYPDRDAGFIEGTGRNPSKHQFTALFRNGIAGEKDVLFPTRWQKFIAACADRTTGVLNHPTLGNLKVKCVSCSTKWDPNRRDGVDVEVSFIETSDEEESNEIFNKASPMAAALASAADLDAACADVSPVPEYPDSLSPSALETMKALSGSVDMFKRGIGNIGAAIDSTIGGLEQFAGTLSSVGELGSDPNVAKALRSLSRCSDALLNLSLTVTSKGKPITQAVTQNDAAADTVASFFGMGLDDFLRLNPRAASKPRIARNTTVFIFA